MSSMVFTMFHASVISLVQLGTCFKCYNDECVAGYQYCVTGRQRCYHCKDRANPCQQDSMLSDCKAYCTEVSLIARVRSLEVTINNLTETARLAVEELKNRTQAENQNLNTEITKIFKEQNITIAQCKDVQTSVLVWKTLSGVVLSLFLLTVIISVYILVKQRKKIRFLNPESQELLDVRNGHIGNSRQDIKNSNDNETDLNTCDKRCSKDSAMGSTSLGSEIQFDDNGADVSSRNPCILHPGGQSGNTFTPTADDENSNKAALVCNSADNEFFKKLKN